MRQNKVRKSILSLISASAELDSKMATFYEDSDQESLNDLATQIAAVGARWDHLKELLRNEIVQVADGESDEVLEITEEGIIIE